MRSLRHKRQIKGTRVSRVIRAMRINDRCQVFEEARRVGTGILGEKREKEREEGGEEEG